MISLKRYLSVPFPIDLLLPFRNERIGSVGKQLVNVPQFMVRMDSEKHIDFSITSPYGQGRPDRVSRKRAASKAAAGGGDDEESDE